MEHLWSPAVAPTASTGSSSSADDAAEILRAILARIECGELTVSGRVRSRLEGAVMALDASAAKVKGGSRRRP
jgi:hypothetical protein